MISYGFLACIHRGVVKCIEHIELKTGPWSMESVIDLYETVWASRLAARTWA